MNAFTAARVRPALTSAECDQLISALEAWEQPMAQTVRYGHFLAGPSARSSVSFHGIFPKVRAPAPSKYELERKAKAEEEARGKLEADAREQSRMEQMQAKRRAGAGQRGGSPSRGQAQEDLKRSQRDEQLRRE